MGYFEDRVELEEVPAKKRYKPDVFAAVRQLDYEARQEVIERNRERIEEARRKDRELDAQMLILDRVETIVDSVVSAIDRYTAVQACKHPITININAPNCEIDKVQKAVSNVLVACNNSMNEVNGEYSPIKFLK